ncbi:proliferating cell nuclear antigen (pcna) [Candidatus Nanohalobium constans]|uniref:DNA polymerase sliding clamp n=1 Tax=Candidatus Nanohalobium constans TaxID=2565781 RepID=A0A5Q0UGU2_9ARCH|nr:proliferating cell nuclear antigen (pcna) [Candidatus Nanohalobium constans]QGA80199.1 DNA polymerase sliding clamp [Candidatus Nanohalobium constans]
MFKAEIEEVGLLKDSMKTISDLISEGLFQLTEDGIQLVAADPAMVGLVDFTLKEEVFETYEINEETKVGLNIENLYSILRRANSGDTITLSVDEDTSKFKIEMVNNSTRDFSLPILNLSEDDIPSVGDLDQFTFNTDLDTSVLEGAIKDAMVVSDAVTITADGDSLNISAEGDQSGVDFTVESGAEGVHEMSGSDAKSMFSLDYLSKMIGAKKLADTVTVKLGQDFPMRMEFTQPDQVDLNFVLAPRIEED